MPPVLGERLAFLEETLDTESIVSEHPALPATTRFLSVLKRLRWSGRRIRRLVRAAFAQLYGQAHTTAPDLCADAKSWARSGFRTLSTSTEAFLKRENAIDALTERLTGPLDYPETFGKYLRRLLVPTENSEARRTDETIGKLELQVRMEYLSLAGQAGLET